MVSPRKSRKKSLCFSSTVTRMPARASRNPSIMPAGPPPAMQQVVCRRSFDMDLVASNLALGAGALRRAKITTLSLINADPGLALVDQKIERRRLANDARQDAMGLAAVVGLMVEEMQQNRGQILHNLGRATGRAIGEPGGGEISLLQR